MIFVGIDPGANGAVGLVSEDGCFLAAFDLPSDPARLFAKLSVPRSPLTEICVALEEPRAMPDQSSSTTAAQFRAVGQVEGVLAATGLPVTLVAAHTWKAKMRITLTADEREPLSKSDRTKALKQKSRDMARCLWPEARLSKASPMIVKESWAEACLIAEWLRRRATA